ncbi:tyrosine-type recombinase/integrase [Flavicella sp.]|uniref:tyrosine-type recombinase/integrase n=1 Tax=Flavicella sp. TaxID=2957742 RepID=UPI0030159C10
MPTLTFNIRPLKKNQNIGSINLRYSWKKGVSPFRKSTGLNVPLNSWDLKKERVKKNTEAYAYGKKFNAKIEKIIDFFDTLEKNYKSSGKEFTRAAISLDYHLFDKGVEKNTENEGFTASLAKYIDLLPTLINKSTKKPVSKRTIQSFKTTNKYVDRFQKSVNTTLKFSDINLDFHAAFMSYLQNEHKLALNTTGGYVKDIKTFCKYSSRNKDVHSDSLSSEFFIVRENTQAIYLDEKEIDLIYNHDFSENPRYGNVRDWMIIGLWTGLRASDWHKVEEMKNGFVTLKMQKTEGIVMIPIHWQIEEILKKRKMPKPVSDVEFNRIIKKVCYELGITEIVHGSRRSPETNRKEVGYFPKNLLISSHTCRRSFATNLYKADFPTLSIMKITGHKTESSFLKYIKVTPREHADKLKKHWDLKYKKI